MQRLEDKGSFKIPKNFASIDHLTPTLTESMWRLSLELSHSLIKSLHCNWPSDVEHANQSNEWDHINLSKVVKSDKYSIASFICPKSLPPYFHVPLYLQLQTGHVSGLHPQCRQCHSGKYCFYTHHESYWINQYGLNHP